MALATVGQTNHTCVIGPLIAHTGDGVYLGDGVAHTVTFIRAENVEKVVLDRPLAVVSKTRVRQTIC
jgi:hypothetical protein